MKWRPLFGSCLDRHLQQILMTFILSEHTLSALFCLDCDCVASVQVLCIVPNSSQQGFLWIINHEQYSPTRCEVHDREQIKIRDLVESPEPR